ncbi:MAG: hypothetical protein LBD63_01175, partial [Mycoplasmataceae bacterium]|nr:hypothetical protein [Mycoplasmataceae bacterium]
MENKNHRHNKIKIALTACALVVGLGGGIGVGYAIWHSQNNRPVPINNTLDVKGMRDLAVPYRYVYEYECKGGTLSIDGELPSFFKFSNNVLVCISEPDVSWGTFKLKATANDGSGNTKIIPITYYKVTEIPPNNCVCL